MFLSLLVLSFKLFQGFIFYFFVFSQGDADREHGTQPDNGSDVETETVLTPDQKVERPRARKSAASMTIAKASVEQEGLAPTLNPGDVADDVAGESGDHGVVPSQQ